MTDELEQRKKEAEIRKLETETAALKHPFAKPANWIPLFVAAGGILTAIAQWQISDIRQEKAALEAERRLFEAEKALATTKQELTEQERLLADARSALELSQTSQAEAEEAKQRLIAEQSQAQAALSVIETKIQRRSQLLAQLDTQSSIQPELDAAATEIARETKQLDQQIAEGISELRSQYQLSGELSEEEVQELIRRINAEERAARLSAMRVLTDDYRSSSFVIAAVLDLFDPESIEQLSASGRINALYFLRTSNPDSWSPPLKAQALSSLAQMEDRHKQGIARIGPQTRDHIDRFERFLSDLQSH
jgi:hypothetical protein